MSRLPPQWADRLLEWFCDGSLLEDLQGDLHEIYFSTVQQKGENAAARVYWWLVLRSFRWSALRKPEKLKNSVFAMTNNNFKIAFRILARDKANTAINLLGLTIGIACFLLMGLYVKQELSFDKFHSKKDRIYRSWLKEDYGEGKVFFSAHTPLRFEELFEQNFPEVEKSVQYVRQEFLVGRGERRIEETVAVISPDFFEVFDFRVANGAPGKMLPDVKSVALSSSYATKYFGDEDPVGKPLGIQVEETIEDFTVTAVYEDMPFTSSIRFDMAISTENSRRLYGNNMTGWFTIIPETYVLLKENVSIAGVDAKMQDVVMGFLADEVERDQYNIGFQPLTDIHLNPDIPAAYAPVSNPQYIYILGAIGLLVLVIALVNYTTLSVGQSLRRGREVGMRKVLGASQGTLVFQYLSESLLIALVAMTAATILTVLLIPAFNTLTGATIFFTFEWWHVAVYLAIGLFIGIVAGVYPAFVLSGYRIIAILRGGSSGPGRQSARKGILVFQFLITVFLISTTLIMRKQVNYLQSKDLGYSYKAVVSVVLQPSPAAQRMTERMSTASENGKLLKAVLEKYPEVTSIGMGSHVFGTDGWAQLAFTDEEGAFRRFNFLQVDAGYFNTFDIRLKEGRTFEAGNGLDERQSVVINQAAAEYFGLDNPVGQKLPGRNFGEHRIIGVTEDFNFTSLHTKVAPLVIAQNALVIFEGVSDYNFGDSVIPKLVFTYEGNDLAAVGSVLSKEWEGIFPNEALQFSFVDQNIQQQYENEARLNKLISVATVISIIIAVLGLLGLTVLVVNSKVKEIGIRKIMGATPLTIFVLLSRNFAAQLLIAIVLSVPLTLWLMNSWLDNFAYRTEIGAALFVVSAVVAMAIAGVVILYHTVRAAKINPVESLRAE